MNSSLRRFAERKFNDCHKICSLCSYRQTDESVYCARCHPKDVCCGKWREMVESGGGSRRGGATVAMVVSLWRPFDNKSCPAHKHTHTLAAKRTWLCLCTAQQNGDNSCPPSHTIYYDYYTTAAYPLSKVF